MSNVNIEPEWFEQLKDEFEKPYMKDLKAFLKSEYEKGKTIYPPKNEYFSAFNNTPFSKVKAVIVGQDPYHGPDQAHGLCFSVRPGVKIPPSLVNIYKELMIDLNIQNPPTNGYLMDWAHEGVFLLNATLTVEKGQAGSHQKKGWEEFTDAALKKLNEREEPLVFILWGSFAQKKGDFIDEDKHLVLKAPHPSPLSAHRGFFQSQPFTQANQFLKEQGQEPIAWEKVLFDSASTEAEL